MSDLDEDAPARRQERPWRTQRLPPLVGYLEAVEILGVQKAALSRWLKPGSGQPGCSWGPDDSYMIPPARVGSGPVWVREDVERFAVQFGRKRAAAGEGEA